MLATSKDGSNTPEAVVDWVCFVVQLNKASNGGHLHKRFRSLGVSRVEPIDKGAGAAARSFEIRLQNPDGYETIAKIVNELEESYGLVSPPTLKGVEVSIDFYNPYADMGALRIMTERLMNTIVPPVIVNPRLIGATKAEQCQLPARGGVDSAKTLYIGDRHDQLLWRVYLKQTDQTEINDNGVKVPKQLPPNEYRARAEVRIQGEALKQIGLEQVSDLKDFPFQRIHARGWFKFAQRKNQFDPILTNEYSRAAGAAIGIDGSAPACVVNRFGRKDKRGRRRLLSKHLKTDQQLTEQSRMALLSLTRRFRKSRGFII